ncbi:hypothetical protein [Salinispora fenicalii]|uniref:hypothetical protein n=1 Tax=Salinispora fenicalii TaxID=1137263 RepID=UPI0004826915|nr:hypothetical protein [Salinispora fenicalii]
MSNYQAQNNAVNPQAASKRRRKLWLAAGLTGAVSIAAVGLTGVGAGARDLAQSAAQIASSGGQGADTGGEGREGYEGYEGYEGREGHEGDWDGNREGGWEEGREGGWEDRREGDWDGNRDAGDRGKKKRGKEVPCKTDKLIQAIVYANNNQGGVLELAKDCTYTLTRSDDEGNGLPIIEERITLLGDNTKIVRADNAELFRILNVGRSGHLKVKDLVIKGGKVGPLVINIPVDGAADPGEMPPFSNSADAPQDGDPGGVMPPCGDCGKDAKNDHHERHSNDGGGVLVQDGGTAEFEKTHLVDNQAGGVGGGIANFGKTELYHTTADGNAALLPGGGIFNAGVLKISKSKVTTNNTVSAGGGIANGAKFIAADRRDIAGGTVRIEKAEIADNATFGPGGGLSDVGGDTTIERSQIKRNMAGSGGGISAVDRSNLHLKETELQGNVADVDGGGLNLRDGAVANVVKSEIKKNRSVRGGGVANHRSMVTFRDSTISDNFAGSRAGGVYNVRGEVDLSNSKVSHNRSTFAPGGAFNERGEFTVDNKSAIKGNSPTNCEGSPDPIENCFG